MHYWVGKEGAVNPSHGPHPVTFRNSSIQLQTNEKQNVLQECDTK